MLWQTVVYLLALTFALVSSTPILSSNDREVIRKPRHIGGFGGGGGIIGGGIIGGGAVAAAPPLVAAPAIQTVPIVSTVPVITTVPVVSAVQTIPSYGYGYPQVRGLGGLGGIGGGGVGGGFVGGAVGFAKFKGGFFG